MAIEIGITGQDAPKDTTDHAVPYQVGKYGDKADRLLIPGIGLILSKHAYRDCASNVEKLKKEMGSGTCNSNYELLIPEEMLLDLVKSLKKYYEMHRKDANNTQDTQDTQDHKDTGNYGIHDHEKYCYPGTDTRDPDLDPLKNTSSAYHNRNEFEIDKSDSTIRISVPSGYRYLNGSIVEHNKYISINITTPDSRHYCELSLTFDQFATALVSSSEVPCTIDRYWGVNKDSVMLREVVKPPLSIKERMEQRLDDRLKEFESKLADLQTKLENKINDNKPLTKTQIKDLNQELCFLKGCITSNRNFTIEQSLREVASITEQIAISLSKIHDIPTEEILSHIDTNPTVKAIDYHQTPTNS